MTLAVPRATLPTLAPVLILLPPSEGKTAPRRGKALDLGSLSSPSLTTTRTTLLESLVRLCGDDPDKAAAVLGLGPAQRDLVQRNADLEDAPTARADAIYTGVLYDALGFDTLSPAARRRATARVAITSSLFGIVRPGDRIPAYRLSGDATLPARVRSPARGARSSARPSPRRSAPACSSTSAPGRTPPSGGRTRRWPAASRPCACSTSRPASGRS